MQIPVLLDGVQEMQIGVNAIQDYQESNCVGVYTLYVETDDVHSRANTEDC